MKVPPLTVETNLSLSYLPSLFQSLIEGKKFLVNGEVRMGWERWENILVQVVGSMLLAWVDAYILWGSMVKAFVTSDPNLIKIVEGNFPQVLMCDLPKAISLEP